MPLGEFHLAEATIILRLARDVTFYREAYADLAQEETNAWTDHSNIRAGQFVLSDVTPYGAFVAPTFEGDVPKPTSNELMTQEDTGCPQAVLNSVPD